MERGSLGIPSFPSVGVMRERRRATSRSYIALAMKTNMNLMSGAAYKRLPFTENAEWFCWGRWLNQQGDWQFDKERIRHELEKALYAYRYCPALQPSLVEDVL